MSDNSNLTFALLMRLTQRVAYLSILRHRHTRNTDPTPAFSLLLLLLHGGPSHFVGVHVSSLFNCDISVTAAHAINTIAGVVVSGEW